MIVPQNSTSVRRSFLVVDDDGAPISGLVAATLPPINATFNGGDDVLISLTDRGSIGGTWSSGSVFEIGGGNYSLDIPNALFTAQGTLTIGGDDNAAGKHAIALEIDILNLGGVEPTGARVVTVHARDQADVALEGVKIRLANGIANQRVGDSDASGNVSFSLDDGDWTVAATLPGYAFTPATITVDATHTAFNLTLAANVITPPADPGRSVVYGVLVDGAGEFSANERLQYRLVDPPTGDGVAHDRGIYETGPSDSDGTVSVELLALSRYEFRRRQGPWTSVNTSGGTVQLPRLVTELDDEAQ